MMKSQRGVVWPYLLLSVALVGALSFGWYQNRQKNQLALQNENKYMSAFHKLKWTSENIEERSSRLMATNDRQLQESLLADLRVYSAQAVEHMSVLPFGNMNTPRVESFLKTLRDKSDEYHYKVATGGTLSADDWKQLGEMRKQSVFFESELSNLLGLVGNGMIRWRDTVRATGPANTGGGATPITRSVVQLDKALQAPPGEEKALQPGVSPMAPPRTDPGPRVDVGSAIASIKRFVDMPLKDEPKVTGQSDPADKEHLFSIYFISATKANGTPLNFGVSVHGGHVIWMLDGRPVKEKRLSTTQLVDKSRQMLRKWGFGPVEYVSAAENDGTLVMDFAPIEKGVAVQVDRIKVSLAMDNGELVGYDARSYWGNRYDRKLSTPKLDATAAKGRLAPRLQVEGQPVLSLIADRRSKERLVWEFRTRMDDQRYRVFIDATTGEEVDVERIVGDPAPPQVAG